MLVSVIVLSKNSEQFIRECLISLQKCRQVYPDMEVILVDNFSQDMTREIAKEFPVAIYLCGPERMAQANLGVRVAKGDMIYLTGSDMTRDWDFIKQCSDRIREGCDAIYMSVKTHPRVKHFWGKVKKLERECYIGTFIESARFFRKSVWEQLGGFNEKIIGMEEDFQHRLDNYGSITGRVFAREYHLHEDSKLTQVFMKSFYYGKYMRAYLREHRTRGLCQLYPVRPNFKLFLRHPKLLLGLVIYKLVQYGGGLCGLLAR